MKLVFQTFSLKIVKRIDVASPHCGWMKKKKYTGSVDKKELRYNYG
jgi:hypothetical protein